MRNIYSGVLVLALFAFVSNGAISKTHPATHGGKYTEKANGNANADKEKAVESTFFINELPPAKGSDESSYIQAKDSKEEFWESWPDWIIAIFTVVLSISTICLWLDTKRLAEDAKSQSADLKESLKLAREEFNATHRPKITVRYVKIDMKNPTADHKYSIEFGIVNVGDADAKIINICSRIIEGEGPWTYGSREVRFDESNISTHRLRPGTLHICSTIKDFPFGTKSNNWFVVGCIRYEDGNGIKRQTGFVRRYKASKMTWEKYKYEEFEYAD